MDQLVKSVPSPPHSEDEQGEPLHQKKLTYRKELLLGNPRDLPRPSALTGTSKEIEAYALLRNDLIAVFRTEKDARTTALNFPNNTAAQKAHSIAIEARWRLQAGIADCIYNEKK